MNRSSRARATTRERRLARAWWFSCDAGVAAHGEVNRDVERRAGVRVWGGREGSGRGSGVPRGP